MRWIDTRKADGRYRSRFVALENKAIKKEHEKIDPEDVFSSIPPIEGLKALVSHMMTQQVDPANGEALRAGC